MLIMIRRFPRSLHHFLKKNDSVIFLVNANPSHLSSILPFIPFLSEKRRIIFCNRATTPNFSSEWIQTIHDYLTVQDCNDLDDFIFNHLSLEWYREPSLLFEGLYLGHCVEYEFQRYITPRLKLLALLKKLKGIFPSFAWIIMDDSGELAALPDNFKDSVKYVYDVFSHDLRWLSSMGKTASHFFSRCLDLYANRKVKKICYDGRVKILVDQRLSALVQSNKNYHSVYVLLEQGLRLKKKMARGGYFSLFSFQHDKILKQSFRETWQKLSESPSFIDKFYLDGFSFWPSVREWICRAITESFPRIIENKERATFFLQQNKIKGILLKNDQKEFERTLVYAARKIGLFSWVLQHGVLAESNGHHHLICDAFLAWGEASREWFSHYGHTSKKILTTGNPKFDEVPIWKPSLSRDAFCGLYGLEPFKKTIVLITQQINTFSTFWTADTFTHMADVLLKYVAVHDSVQLLIKADPYESMDSYKELISKWGKGVVVREAPLYELLFHSDVVVTLDSTVGLEAMFFEKPLIQLNLMHRKDRVCYDECGAAVRVHSESALNKILNKIISGDFDIKSMVEAQKRFIQKYAYALDGKSSERMHHEIDLMMQGLNFLSDGQTAVPKWNGSSIANSVDFPLQERSSHHSKNR